MHVAQRRPLVVGQLRRHPRPGVGFGQSAADQPLHPQFRVRPHPDHQVEGRGGRQRGEQRDVVDHHRIGGGACCWISANLARTSGWVIRSSVGRAAGSANTTAASAARSSAPSAADHVGAEALGDGRQAGRAGRDHLPGQLVGIDDDRAALAQGAATTVDLPDPMPPVTATVIIDRTLSLRSRDRRSPDTRPRLPGQAQPDT